LNRVNLFKKNRKKQDPFERGLDAGINLTRKCKQQSNLPKVYVLGKRIHHGPVGVLLAVLGLYYNKPYLAGYGASLALDDLDDIQDWLKFEDKPNFSNEDSIEIL